MGKEVKEIRLGAEGLKTYLEVQGEEVKITNFDEPNEIDKAHAYLISIIVEQFFELIEFYAQEKGVRLCEVFDSQEEMDTAFKNYIADFMKKFVENCVMTSKTNYEMFKRQRELAKTKKCDA